MKSFDIFKAAKDVGFTNTTSLDVDTLEFLPEIRSMCEDNLCQQYDKRWSCPPACGTIEECRAATKEYKNGIILQTTGELEDPYDYYGMLDIEKVQHKKLQSFAEVLLENGIDFLAMGSGACTICEQCSYPDEPCKFPEKLMIPIEAFGVWVSDLCQKNDIPYNYGENTLTYTGVFLY